MFNDVPFSSRSQTVFELDPAELEVLNRCKEKIKSVCTQHLHKPVRIQTVHGATHEGTIVHVDHEYAYLQVSQNQSRAFLPYPYAPGYSPYYGNVVLPLALYSLLAIALL